MRFKGFDLNLLATLDVLLETRSVSRTAEKLHLSQPAVSAALNRIREYFNDDILVTRSKKMYPTALADTLRPRIRQALRGIDGLLTASSFFDPDDARTHLPHRRFGLHYRRLTRAPRYEARG